MTKDLLAFARQFAVSAHGDQKYDDQPYSTHLEDVVGILRTHGIEDPHVLSVGILHDVVEDTHATAQDLRDAGFPEIVVQGVLFCTDELGTTRKERKAKTYLRVKEDIANGALGVICGLPAKWADRIANLKPRSSGRSLLGMYQKESAAFMAAYRVEGSYPNLLKTYEALIKG